MEVVYKPRELFRCIHKRLSLFIHPFTVEMLSKVAYQLIKSPFLLGVLMFQFLGWIYLPSTTGLLSHSYGPGTVLFLGTTDLCVGLKCLVLPICRVRLSGSAPHCQLGIQGYPANYANVTDVTSVLPDIIIQLKLQRGYLLIYQSLYTYTSKVL